MTSRTYAATTEGREYKIRVTSDRTIEVNGKQCEFDFSEVEEGTFSLIVSGSSYTIDLKKHDLANAENSRDDGQMENMMELTINGRNHQVEIYDQRTLLLRSFLAKAKAEGGGEVVRAPMPGLISRIEVAVGQELKKGQGLLVLEAMKMENEIRVQSNCKVRAIHVEKGRPVEKGEPLVTLERA